MRRINSLFIVHPKPFISQPLASALRARRCFVATGTRVGAALRLVSTVRFDAIAAAADLPDGKGADLLDALRVRLPTAGLLLLGPSPLRPATFVGLDEPYDAGNLLQLAELAAAEAAFGRSEGALRRRVSFRH
jgi:hypothetical protein